MFRRFLAGPSAGSGEVWLNWVIRERSSKACIGTLQATYFASGELWAGYKIIPPWWGRGVATAGVTWLLDELQSRFPGVPVLASVDTRNLGSVRVLEKCGFTREGLARRYLCINGVWQDHLLFGLLHEDFRG